MSKKKEAFVLSVTATVEEALAALRDGDLTQAQYLEWDTAARPFTIVIDGQSLILEPRENSSGSFGFGYYGKVNIKVGQEPVKFQASLSLTVEEVTPSVTRRVGFRF